MNVVAGSGAIADIGTCSRPLNSNELLIVILDRVRGSLELAGHQIYLFVCSPWACAPPPPPPSRWTACRLQLESRHVNKKKNSPLAGQSLNGFGAAQPGLQNPSAGSAPSPAKLTNANASAADFLPALWLHKSQSAQLNSGGRPLARRGPNSEPSIRAT